MRWEIDMEVPTPPEISPPEQIRSEMESFQVENLTLITPILGGGVHALENDATLPIRGQEIKGQLRFWWRTFQTAGSVKELWEKECELWGGQENASQVSIGIDITANNWNHITYTKETKESCIPKYVIFPLDNAKDASGSFSLMDKGCFSLTIAYPASRKQEVLDALRLWILFGGLGARTRRGMGCVYSPKWPKWSESEIIEWLHQLVPYTEEPITSFVPEWPSLLGAHFFCKKESIINSACGIKTNWKLWLNQYQKFRQHRVDKDTGKTSPFGKSTWPEPDAIRDIDKKKSPKETSWFPRGAYGLPILFHFPPNHDDMNYTLSAQDRDGNDLDRWSSPLFIKVQQLDAQNCLKIYLKLNSPMPATWTLKNDDTTGPAMVLHSMHSPLAKHPASDPPLQGKDPYTALFTHMSGNAAPIILGNGGME
ncbi:MAG: type III-B CRISPR module RAMP protein Cmr1 [Desulfoplanes sp.]